MSEKQTTRALETIAKWCLMTHQGIELASGKPKKPPTYWIVRCPHHGIVLTSSKQVTYKSKNDDAMKCVERASVQVGSKGTSTSYPASAKCNRRVELVREIGQE